MKEYKKAELIAKNLPTGSYAAGCPTGRRSCVPDWLEGKDQWGNPKQLHKSVGGCQMCEVVS
ncbi:MAG: hypothetical protein J5542_00570 [Bacteroidales bacterium]|nr:hypothetical protein [Bacteroidales bacterium]